MHTRWIAEENGRLAASLESRLSLEKGHAERSAWPEETRVDVVSKANAYACKDGMLVHVAFSIMLIHEGTTEFVAHLGINGLTALHFEACANGVGEAAHVDVFLFPRGFDFRFVPSVTRFGAQIQRDILCKSDVEIVTESYREVDGLRFEGKRHILDGNVKMVASPCRRHVQTELVAGALRCISVEIEAAAKTIHVGNVVLAEGADAVNGARLLPTV